MNYEIFIGGLLIKDLIFFLILLSWMNHRILNFNVTFLKVCLLDYWFVVLGALYLETSNERLTRAMFQILEYVNVMLPSCTAFHVVLVWVLLAMEEGSENSVLLVAGIFLQIKWPSRLSLLTFISLWNIRPSREYIKEGYIYVRENWRLAGLGLTLVVTGS